MPHIHVHLHNGKVTQDTEDSGTSEGARKAAETRKAHGGGGSKIKTKVHPTGYRQKIQVSKPLSTTTEQQEHLQRIKTAHSLGVEPEHMYSNHRRRAGDPRLSGDSARDAGTSEGAKKAALTRKQHGGGQHTSNMAQHHANLAKQHEQKAKQYRTSTGNRIVAQQKTSKYYNRTFMHQTPHHESH
jgi:hypothetical protein